MKRSIAPFLLYPFSTQPHPAQDLIAQHTHSWVREQGLILEDETWRQFKRIDAPGLAAYACPYGSIESVEILSDWIAWLYLLDDLCDEDGLDKDPARRVAFFDELLDYCLRGRAAHPSENRPLFLAARGLFERMASALDEDFAAWYAKPLRKYFDALLWEEDNRHAGRIASLQDYAAWRIYAGAVFLMFGLSELLIGRRFARGFHEDLGILELSQSAARVICWANDLFSFQREAAANDIHNLVLLIEDLQGCSRNGAVEASIQMHNDEMRTFLTLVERLADAEDKDRRVYGAMLKVWLQGAFDWTLKTQRYQDFAFTPEEIGEIPLTHREAIDLGLETSGGEPQTAL